MDNSIPLFGSAGDLFRWVLVEGGGMCPTPPRMRAYLQRSRHSTHFGDVSYHVDSVGCPLCVELVKQAAEVPGLLDSMITLEGDASHGEGSGVHGDDVTQRIDDEAIKLSTPAKPLSSEDIAFRQKVFERVLTSLERAFPRLKRKGILEDAISVALIELFEGGVSETELIAAIRKRAYFRVIDHLRKSECQAIEELISDPRGETPSRTIARQERRKPLTVVLRTYVAEHEKTPIGLRRRQVFERTAHGEKPSEIAASMSITVAISADTVAQDRLYNNRWFHERFNDDLGLASLLSR